MSGSEESVQSRGGSEMASARQRLNVRDFGLTADMLLAIKQPLDSPCGYG